MLHVSYTVFFFLKILFFREGKGGRGREGEKHQCVVASHTRPLGALGWQPRHVP